MRMQRVLLLWALQLACHKHIVAISSIHKVQGKSTGCKFTERMFGDGHGPFGMGGRSTITINATIAPLSDQDVTDTITFHRLREYFDFAIVAISYTNIDRFTHLDEHSICTYNFTDPIHGNVDGLLYGEFHIIEQEFSVHINTEFRPRYSGLQVVMIVPCWKQKQEAFGYPVSTTEYSLYPMRDPLFCVTTTIAFRNPYGYLPASLYGMFPFSGCLSLLYGFVDIWLITLINKHRRSPLRLHYLFLFVLLLATGESIAWYIPYHTLNSTGQRVCCPYAGAIVVSTILKITAAMVTRVATTLTCLGFGVLRPTISRHELFVLIGLGVSYFISVGGLEISHIQHQTDRTTRDSDTRSDAVWEVLVLATNTCFAGCIFTSLALTRKDLAEFNQIGHYCRTCKLKRYTVLARVVLGYILLSFFLMSAEGAVYAGTLMLEWQYVWMIWAANRLVMFSALLVVTVAWRPNNVDDDDELNVQNPGSDGSLNREDPDVNETTIATETISNLKSEGSKQ